MGPVDNSSPPEGLPSPTWQPLATVSNTSCSCDGNVEPKGFLEGFPRDGISEEGWRGDELPVSTAAPANGPRTVGGRMDTLLLVRMMQEKSTSSVGWCIAI